MDEVEQIVLPLASGLFIGQFKSGLLMQLAIASLMVEEVVV